MGDLNIGILAFRAPNQGLERSCSCWTAGHRLAQTELACEDRARSLMQRVFAYHLYSSLSLSLSRDACAPKTNLGISLPPSCSFVVTIVFDFHVNFIWICYMSPSLPPSEQLCRRKGGRVPIGNSIFMLYIVCLWVS